MCQGGLQARAGSRRARWDLLGVVARQATTAHTATMGNHQDDGEDQAHAEAEERRVHALDLALDRDLAPRW